MPDSERKIEKLLRAFAKRRRDESTEPFRLHGATRQMFQQEISRRANPSPRPEGWLAKILFPPRRRIAFALASFFIIGLGIAVFVTTTSEKKSSVTLANVTKEVPGETDWHFADDTNPIVGANLSPENQQLYAVVPPDSPLASSTALETKTDLDKRKTQREQETFSLEATSIDTKTEAISSPSATAVTRLERQPAAASPALSAIDTSGLSTDAEHPTLAAKKEELAGNVKAAESDSNRDGYFVTTNRTDGLLLAKTFDSETGKVSGESYRFRRQDPAKDSAAHPVLRSFQVVRQGTKLEVIDEDGSVYTGTFGPALNRELAAKSRPNESEKLSAPKDSRAASSPSADPVTSATVPVGGPFPTQTFRVSGTNRTLKAPVVLTGTFLTESHAAFARFTTGGSLKSEAPTQILILRISGKARVGTTEVPIEAHRVPR